MRGVNLRKTDNAYAGLLFWAAGVLSANGAHSKLGDLFMSDLRSSHLQHLVPTTHPSTRAPYKWNFLLEVSISPRR